MEYVVASLDQYYWNKVAVITMKKAPSVDDTFKGGDFQRDVNVRYWSFCVGDLAITGTPFCLCDDEIHRNPDGESVTIIIARYSLKSKIQQAGLNYMAWGLATYKPVLIHRHLLAAHDFVGKIANVPAIGRPLAEKIGMPTISRAIVQNTGWETMHPRARFLMYKTFSKVLIMANFRSHLTS